MMIDTELEDTRTDGYISDATRSLHWDIDVKIVPFMFSFRVIWRM